MQHSAERNPQIVQRFYKKLSIMFTTLSVLQLHL